MGDSETDSSSHLLNDENDENDCDDVIDDPSNTKGGKEVAKAKENYTNRILVLSMPSKLKLS